MAIQFRKKYGTWRVYWKNPYTGRQQSEVGRLYTVLRWAYKRGILDRLPRFPERPSYHCKKFVPPSEEELARIIEAASPHIQRIVIIGAKLGLRVGPSELLKMQWKDVDLEKKLVIVHAARKNPEEPFREVPIRDDLLPLFKAWHAQDAAQGLAYVITYKGKPVSHIKTAWTATLRRAGITRTIRPYDLRHAFATDAIAGGADVGTVAKLMGHANATMVLQHYQHVLTTQKIAAIGALPSLPLYDQKLYVQKKSEPVQ